MPPDKPTVGTGAFMIQDAAEPAMPEPSSTARNVTRPQTGSMIWPSCHRARPFMPMCRMPPCRNMLVACFHHPSPQTLMSWKRDAYACSSLPS